MASQFRFSSEYARSDRSQCNLCKIFIIKGQLRLGVIVQSATHDDEISNWYHFQCFFDTQTLDNFYCIKNIEILRWKDIKLIKNKILSGKGLSSIEDLLKHENNLMWKIRDCLEKEKIPKSILTSLLEYNDQYVPSGKSSILNCLSDLMAFGCLNKCLECGGHLTYENNRYKCKSNINEWTKCPYETKEVTRSQFKIKQEYQDYEITKNYKFVPQERTLIQEDVWSNVRLIGEKSTSHFSIDEDNSSMSKVIKIKGDIEKLETTVKTSDSMLGDEFHIYRDSDSDDPFSETLMKFSFVEKKNSFYRLHLLKCDYDDKWCIFRSWGRIGTQSSSNKEEMFSIVSDAIEEFERIYFSKTGNHWKDRYQVKKNPGKYYPIDTDYDFEQDNLNKDFKRKSLVRFIFSIDSIKEAMIKKRIDFKKMPLGKFSTNQIELSKNVLNELNELLTASETPTKFKLLDASTRFYTLLPHDSSCKTPVLDSLDLIELKFEMIKDLESIEMVHKILTNNIDDCYEKLNNNINSVEKGSDIYKRIEKCVQNSNVISSEKCVQNSNINNSEKYTLDILNIFKLEKDNGSVRFSEVPNHMMLWHGSRLSSWVGILSEGLRITPPGIKTSGDLFGKGIYFADIIYKSANYCDVKKPDQVGLVIMCEVALGKMVKQDIANRNIKLKEGEHSCKGVGVVFPDPNGDFFDEYGTKYPLGDIIKSDNSIAHLAYNEYIVYNEDQVKQRYLVKVRFNYL